jgi:hypothetical protein
MEFATAMLMVIAHVLLVLREAGEAGASVRDHGNEGAQGGARRRRTLVPEDRTGFAGRELRSGERFLPGYGEQIDLRSPLLNRTATPRA